MLAELALAARVLGDAPPPRVDTVFVGGGTPTLLPADDLARILDGIDRTWGLAADAEVTTEANPESVDPGLAAGAARGRLHPDLAGHAVGRAGRAGGAGPPAHRRAGPPPPPLEAREAGFEHVNLDLIYGTPGERAEDFAASLAAVVAAGVDHVSAYALIVEDGTRLAARMRRGELPYPGRRRGRRPLPGRRGRARRRPGFAWYEVSNWARSRPARCRHNLLYWTRRRLVGARARGRTATSAGCAGGTSSTPRRTPRGWPPARRPAQAREVLTADERAHRGRDAAAAAGRRAAAGRARRRRPGRRRSGRWPTGCWTGDEYAAGRAVLTLRGRLLADAVVRDLLP